MRRPSPARGARARGRAPAQRVGAQLRDLLELEAVAREPLDLAQAREVRGRRRPRPGRGAAGGASSPRAW